MYKNIDDYLKNSIEARAFDHYRKGESVPLFIKIRLGLKSIFLDPIRFVIDYFPGGLGLLMRKIFYKLTLNSLGKNCIIDTNTRISGLKNISISDFVWIDRNVELNSAYGSLKVGKRVHVAPYSVIFCGGGVIIEDYVGISSGVKIYSNTEAPIDGKRMSGPMIPQEQKGMKTEKVHIKKDAFLGSNTVVLPGVTIGEGVIIGANSVVRESIPDFSIAVGVPTKIVGTRSKINLADI